MNAGTTLSPTVTNSWEERGPRDLSMAHQGELSKAGAGWNLDIQSPQVAPNQVYIARKEGEVTPGMQYTFYGAYTMERTGEAAVVDAVLNEDEGVTHEFWEAMGKAQVLTWDKVPYLVTLDRDIRISELEVLDYKQVCSAIGRG